MSNMFENQDPNELAGPETKEKEMLLPEKANPVEMDPLTETLYHPDALPETTITQIIGMSGEAHEQGILAIRKAVAEARKKVDPNEREKTPEELVMITRAAENVNLLREKYGLSPITLSPERVKMLQKATLDDRASLYGEEVPLEGSNNPMLQIEKIGERPKEVTRFNGIQHELIHAGSYQAAQYHKENSSIDMYRAGISVTSRQSNKEGEYENFLDPLNEALTEENARRITLSIPEDDPELGALTKRRNETYQEMAKLHERFPTQVANPADFKDDFLICHIDMQKGELNYDRSSYPKERQAMWQLFEKIHEKKS